MLKLSKHFVDNWQDRVGRVPSVAKLRRILRQSVRIQKGRQIYGRSAWIKTLSIYWHPELHVIITVDNYKDTAVSVYSEDMGGRRQIGDVMEGFNHVHAR
nr:hypothetical protein [uncultured Desulfobacter sp.]